MDTFEFDDDDKEESTEQDFQDSCMTGSEECSATSSTHKDRKRGKLKYHRLNHIISSMKRPTADSSDKSDQEQISQNDDVSVSSVNSMHHALGSLDGSNAKRPRRRKIRKPVMDHKTKTQFSHEYFSSSSSPPLDFSSQSSISSKAQLPFMTSVMTNSKDIDNNVYEGRSKQMEILSGDGFGTPPGSPPRRRRRMNFASEVSGDCMRSNSPTPSSTRKNTQSTDYSPVSSTSRNFENSPLVDESLMFVSVPSQKPTCSSLYSVASEGTRQSSKSYGTKASSQKRGVLWKSSQSSQSNASIFSNDSERVATGAGTDVYAMQDAGSSRLILDECNYVCNSFVSGIKGDEGSNGIQKQHSIITADAACDLANMLAVESSRRILLKTSCSDVKSAINVSKEMNAAANSSIFDSILSIFGHIPTSICGSYLPSSHVWHENGEISQEGHLIEWDQCISKRDQDESMQQEKQTSMVIARTKSARNSNALRREKSWSGVKKSDIDSIVTDALAIAAFYISLDCAVDKVTSTASSHSSAKIFQRKLLQNRTFVKGISKLLLADKRVTSILDSIRPQQCVNLNSTNGDDIEPQGDDDICDKHSDLTKISFVDPTSRGRRKKRLRLDNKISTNLEPIQEDMLTSANQRDDDSNAKSLDFFSDDASAKSGIYERTAATNCDKSKLPSWLKQKIRSAYSRLANDIVASDKSHTETCRFCSCLVEYTHGMEKIDGNPGKIAFDALHRLFTGKCSDDDDALDEHDELHSKDEEYLDESNTYSDDEIMTSVEEDFVEKDNLNNPMIFKNFMMRRSGAIPYLTRATTEALEACIAINMHHEEQDKTFCEGCCQYLKKRALRLLGLLDGLCCMSRKNREFICLISKNDNHQTVPLLIPSLLRTIVYFSRSLSKKNDSKFADLGLSSLRTFTNLTHENKSASSQVSFLSVKLENHQSLKPANGVEIILNLLYNLAKSQNCKHNTHHAHAYDGIIYCLNSLTNLLETASFQIVRKMILQSVVASNDQPEDSVDALPWLSRWVVDQTMPFRDAVMSGSFGKSCDEGDKRDLKHDEDEFLVTAGNGVILLACLLGVHKTSNFCESDTDTSSKIQSIIFDSILENGNLLLLMINTLKAFCNYYRYSVGELSVAVITPVLHLITGLERIIDSQ